MTIQNTETLHTEHKDWEAEISYWHNECIYFGNVLLGMLERTEDEKEIDRIEEFKSKFDNLNDRLAEVHNQINAHEQALNDPFANNGLTELAIQHDQMRWQIEEFHKQFRDLKNDFYKFADVDCKY
jgi:chromosome segregation ATPase